MIEIQDRIEDQRVAPDGFAAVHGIVCEQQHIAVSQVRIHDDGMLGNGGWISSAALRATCPSHPRIAG